MPASLICRLLALAVVALVQIASAATVVAEELDLPGVVTSMVEKHGLAHQARIRRGVDQVAQLWRPEDGDAVAFRQFVEEHFVSDPEELADTFGHMEYAMEMVTGHFSSMGRELRHYMDEERGPIRSIDRLLAAFDPSAHVTEDLFSSKVAFVGLLNFPVASLGERLENGAAWTRERWGQDRLTGQFVERVPAEAQQALSSSSSAADAYVAEYNIYMHHVLNPEGERLFPAGKRLITHWNLRDELKSQYALDDGLPRQRMIYDVMRAIVRQEIPAAVVNNPLLDWTPATGGVVAFKGEAEGEEVPAGAVAIAHDSREPDTRYQHILNIFHAMQQIDAATPHLPTAIHRAYNRDREIPIDRVQAIFESLFEGSTLPAVAALIEGRLGRDLEPFDIWYDGFKARSNVAEEDLDRETKKRYPTADAFAADIPRLLKGLGFDRETAQFLAEHIEVDPSRGAGHAFGAQRRDDKAHLRTRVGPDGMDYKGYNIAVHELGHNVEQVFSLNTMDQWLLNGVPNNAFTEALAFVFQGRDLDLLNMAPPPDPESDHLKVLESFWSTCEIASVALVDMDVWRWMYDNPDADAAQLREATVQIARDVWKRTFGRVIPNTDTELLGVYSHMLAYPLYLSHYPLGHLIAFQLEEHFKSAELAPEFERACQLGRLTPDLWMQRAVGSPLSAEPLIEAAGRAVKALRRS